MKKESMIAIVVVGIVIIAGILVMLQKSPEITSFEECAAAGNPIMKSYPRQCSANGQTFVEQVELPTENEGSLLGMYFLEAMSSKAIELNGGNIPVEGFTLDMYLPIFTNLQASDFADVRAIGGHYDYENGELTFHSDSPILITSADGSMNAQGMQDLLENLESRLGTTITTEADVDALIETLI